MPDDGVHNLESMHDAPDHLSLVLDRMPAIVWTTDCLLRVTSFGGGGLRDLDLEPAEIVGFRLDSLLADEELTVWLEACRAALRGETHNFEAQWRSRVYQAFIGPVPHAGAEAGTIGIAFDVTELHDARRQLEQSERRLARAQELAHLGNWYLDVATGMMRWSDETYRIFGIEPIGRPLRRQDYWERVHHDDVARVRAEVARAAAARRNYLIEHRIIRPDGSIRWVQEIGEFSSDAGGRPLAEFGIVFDITERKMFEVELDLRANMDALTGLPNRARLFEIFGATIESAKELQRGTAAIMIDLDRFALSNDSLGHRIGDALLCEVSARLAGMLQPGERLGRVGGDEFLVLVEPPCTAASVRRTVKRLQQTFESPFRVDDGEFFVTASMGVALYPQDGLDPDTLVQAADHAMHAVKRQGRNHCRFYDRQMHHAASRRHQMEHCLRRALIDNELSVVYQPVVEFGELPRVVGAEALVRWNSATLGSISPDEFIAVAEDCGMIRSLGEWVLREACTNARLWQLSGLPPITVSVNVSAHQLNDAGFLKLLHEILNLTGLPPKSLVLELTERTTFGRDETGQRTMEAIRKTGVRMAIDDFGTGYSSLSYLQTLPVDFVKIDKSFVAKIPDDTFGIGIARAVIELAHSLDMTVTAEGVETAVQLKALRDSGCDFFQGYFLGRPMAAADFAATVHRFAARDYL